MESFLRTVQRAVLTPVVAGDLVELAPRILSSEAGQRPDPRPFHWRFARQDFEHRVREPAQPTAT